MPFWKVPSVSAKLGLIAVQCRALEATDSSSHSLDKDNRYGADRVSRGISVRPAGSRRTTRVRRACRLCGTKAGTRLTVGPEMPRTQQVSSCPDATANILLGVLK